MTSGGHFFPQIGDNAGMRSRKPNFGIVFCFCLSVLMGGPYVGPVHAGKVEKPAPPVKPEVMANGRRDVKKVSLTFDACSTPYQGGFDEKIMEVLIQYEVKATFFLGGKWMTDNAETTRKLAANPLFELGSHAYRHPHLTAEPDARISAELERSQNTFLSLTGKRAVLFRPPYGEHDDRVVKIAAGLGITTVGYDLPSGDPDPKADKERLVKTVTGKARNGSIIVLHINLRGWHTAEALPEIVRILREKGFELVTVGELIRDLRDVKGAH